MSAVVRSWWWNVRRLLQNVINSNNTWMPFSIKEMGSYQAGVRAGAGWGKGWGRLGSGSLIIFLLNQASIPFNLSMLQADDRICISRP